MRNLKQLFALALVALASIATGATLSPIQLLNPAGSTAGQAIVSTGASTAPAWGTVVAGSLAPVAANTVIANTTGGAAAPTAFAMPSCSASGNNLQYTTSTGFTCATGYALLASPTFTGTVTTAALTATGAITPSQTIGIIGTTTNNSANAGSVGEVIASQVSAVSLSTGVAVNLTSINLTAGDWDVEGNIEYVPAGTTNLLQAGAGVSTTTSTLPASPFKSVGNYAGAGAGNGQSQWVPVQRLSLASTTTVYLVGFAQFNTSTLTANGYIRARRPR